MFFIFSTYIFFKYSQKPIILFQTPPTQKHLFLIKMKFYFKTLVFLLILCLLPCFQAVTDPSILVSPTIIPTIKQSVGHQVPNGFGPKLIKSTRIYKSYPDCACMSQLPSQCPPCTGTPTNEIYRQVLLISQCECAPRMQCDPCPRLYQAVHEMSLRQVKYLEK